MIEIKAVPGKLIMLGKQGENLAREVIFDVSGVRAEFGDGAFRLSAKRPGEADAYPATVTETGDTVVWALTGADTQNAGRGQCELAYYANETRLKTWTYDTAIAKSLTGSPKVDPYDEFLDEVNRLAAEAAISQRESKTSEDNAKKSEENAKISENSAALSAESAAQSSTSANEAAANAGQSAATAASSAASAADSAATAVSAAIRAAAAAETAEDAKDKALAAEEKAKQHANDATAAIETVNAAKDATLKSAEKVAAAAVEVEENRGAVENAKSEVISTSAAAVTAAVNAKASEDNAKLSETNAKKSETNAAASEANAKTSETSAASSAAAAAKSAEEIPAMKEALDAIREVAEPDDTIVGKKPWTSLNIVEKLCPKVEGSGNPVVLDDCIEDYPMKVVASWEPTQAGSGDPSPENIRAISGKTSVTVTGCGENLLNITPFNKTVKNGVTFEYLADGGMHFFGTATADTDSPIFTVSMLPPGGYYGSDLPADVFGTIIVIRRGNRLWLNAKKRFTIESGDTTEYWYVRVQAGVTVDLTLYPYIISGTTAPSVDKMPYKAQTRNLVLPETVYGGSVDATTGKGMKTWNMITLDGTENWIIGGMAEDKSDWFYQSRRITDAINASPNKGYQYSSHYPFGSVTNNTTGQGVAIVWGTIRVRWADTIPDNTDAWKSYLAAQKAAGTPVTIAYRLAEPVPFTATGAGALPQLDGINTIISDADTLAVEGREDIAKRLEKLETAIASITTETT